MWIDRTHLPGMRRLGFKLGGLALGLVLLVLAPWPETVMGIAGYAPLHTLLEAISIMVCVLVFAVVWSVPNERVSMAMMPLACAFAGVALLDFSHMMSFFGTPDYVKASSPEIAINFWLFARLLAAVAVLGVMLTPSRLQARPPTYLQRQLLLGSALALVAMAHWLVLFHADKLPSTFIPGQGLTTFKLAIEYLVIALNLAAIGVLLWRMQHPLGFNATALLGAVAAMAMSELLFTMHSSVTDIFNLAGHVYKIVAYAFLYRTIFVETVTRPYQSIAETENLLGQLIEAMPTPVYVKGIDGRLSRLNQAWEEFFAMSRQVMIGNSVELLYPDRPDIADLMKSKDQELFAHPGRQTYDASIVTRDGKQHDVVYYKATFRNADGEVAGLIGNVIDVTARKQVENALRTREGELQRIMNVVPAYITRLDASERYLFVNQAYAELLGLSMEEIAGKHIREIAGEATYAEIKPYIQQVLSGNTVRFERILRLADGTLRVLEVAHVPDRDSSGEVCGWFGIHRDATEERLALKSLAESEERYRTLTELAPEAIFVHRNGVVLYANPAAVQLFGATSPAELVGTPFFDRIHPDDRAIAKARVEQLKANLTRNSLMEMQFLKLDGTIIETEIQGTYLIYEGAPAVHASLRDISARKRAEAASLSLEAQLREAQKMQAIGTLAGGIAHDFNNIIATILGNADLARTDVRDNPLALQSLTEIQKAGARARDLVQQILSFSRRQPTELKVLALADVVDESIRLLRALLPASISLQTHCDPAAPPVLADKTQMLQVLINLATNAMQALRGKSGSISIELDEVHVDATLVAQHPSLAPLQVVNAGRAARLQVKDNGEGMDAATLQRIFEPFFTTKPVNEGTGLGLSVVHGIVEAHDGMIVVTSQPVQGSCFSIYLPAQLEPAKTGSVAPGKPDAAPIVSAASGAAPHVLYLDDEEALVFLMRRLLERSGYRVSGFTTQAEALAALRANPQDVDLLVTDYNMPGMSGLDVVVEARAIRKDLPIVMASGFIDDALSRKAQDAGVVELILKATVVEELSRAVQQIVQRTHRPNP